MKAMILAAGFGSRLKPLTNDRPKALVDVAGRPMLAWVIDRLAQQGFTDIIINAHHFSNQIETFASSYANPEVSLTVSLEKEILGTGGGIQKAAWFFGSEMFLVHNVDVLTDMDLRCLMDAHCCSDALVTLAVKERQSSRHLLFDSEGLLCGWRSNVTKEIRLAKQSETFTPLPFMGIYVMSPVVFRKMKEKGPFSIVDFFIKEVSAGEQIRAFRADDARWADLGSMDRIDAAEVLFKGGWFDKINTSYNSR